MIEPANRMMRPADAAHVPYQIKILKNFGIFYKGQIITAATGGLANDLVLRGVAEILSVGNEPADTATDDNEAPRRKRGRPRKITV